MIEQRRDLSNAILVEASLSFLGLGFQPPTASWGNMLTDAQSLTVLTSQPWLWVRPGVTVIITLLSANFIGDGLRNALRSKPITTTVVKEGGDADTVYR